MQYKVTGGRFTSIILGTLIEICHTNQPAHQQTTERIEKQSQASTCVRNSMSLTHDSPDENLSRRQTEGSTPRPRLAHRRSSNPGSGKVVARYHTAGGSYKDEGSGLHRRPSNAAARRQQSISMRGTTSLRPSPRRELQVMVDSVQPSPRSPSSAFTLKSNAIRVQISGASDSETLIILRALVEAEGDMYPALPDFGKQCIRLSAEKCSKSLVS